MAKAGAVARRGARAQRSFRRLGMRSQLIPLDSTSTTLVHCWTPPPGDPSARPPLLVVHGFGWDGATTWELQIEPFLAAQFAVYVPDLLFFGDSTTRSARRDEAFQAECLAAMMQQLGVHSGLRVVGTSYGGVVTFLMASMFPELVHKVVIASSGVCMDAADGAAYYEKIGKPEGMRSMLLPGTVAEAKEAMGLVLFRAPRLPDASYEELLEGIYMKNRDARMELFDETSFGTDKALLRPTLTQEALLVWGQNDRLFDIHQGLKLKKHLGDGVDLVIIKDAGHVPQSEAPEAFNAAVLAFLKSGAGLPQSRL